MSLATTLLVLISILFSGNAITAVSRKEKVKYRTFFGACPSRSAGALALKLMKTFEQTYSLKDVKKQIVDEKLKHKYFLSSYNIDYNPAKGSIKFNFNCPKPVMKVQVYTDSGEESSEAILVSNGDLFDPTYEILLKKENKLPSHLPSLAIPMDQLQKNLQVEIDEMIKSLESGVSEKLSEVILDKHGSLTIILSISGRPSSVFMGDQLWTEKLGKLTKIISYMESRKKIPAVINLINSKKVVVKFSDTI